MWGDSVRLDEELRIGMIDGPDEYVLVRPEVITVDVRGDIFVFDGQVPIIRQYDSSGTHVRDIGRGGDGPGEYRDVRGMHVFDDGRLLIWDVSSARATFYDSSGLYLKSHAHHGLGIPGGDIFFAVDTAGDYYVQFRDQTRAVHMPAVGYPEYPRALYRINRLGQVVDTIPVPIEDLDGPGYYLGTSAGSRRGFGTETVSAFSNRGYLVVGRNRAYALDLADASGAVTRLVMPEPEPVRLTEGEREEWDARFRWHEKLPTGFGGGREIPPLPRTKPVFRDLSVDADGRIWVERYVPAVKMSDGPLAAEDGSVYHRWQEPTTLDVIRPDGTLLGTVVLPRRTRLVYQRGMLLFGVQRGEYGEPYIVRLRIQAGQG